jgi:hypothetical protein
LMVIFLYLNSLIYQNIEAFSYLHIQKMNILPMEIWCEIFAQGLLGSDSDIIQGSQFLCNLRLVHLFVDDSIWREFLRILHMSRNLKFATAKEQIQSLVNKYELQVNISRTTYSGYIPYTYGGSSYIATIRPYWTLQQLKKEILIKIKELTNEDITITFYLKPEKYFIESVSPENDIPLYSQLDFDTLAVAKITFNNDGFGPEFFR